VGDEHPSPTIRSAVNSIFNICDAQQRNARNGDAGDRRGRRRGLPRANSHYYTDDSTEWKPLIHRPGKVPTKSLSRLHCSGSSCNEYGNDTIATGDTWRHVG